MPEDRSADISKDITEIKITLARLEERIHGVPCDNLTQYMSLTSSEFNKIRDKFGQIFNKLEAHNKDYHSENSTSDKWVKYAVIGCTIATLLSPFIAKWLEK